MEYIFNRIEQAHNLMLENGLDVLLLSKKENKAYISGFASSNYYIVLTADKNYLLTDFRYLEAASELKRYFEILLIKTDEDLFNFLKSLKGIKMGAEFEYITFEFYNLLKSKVPDKEISGADKIIQSLRVIKDSEELKKITKAAALADEAFLHILKELGPGAVERDVALKLEFFLKQQGAENLSFDTICVSGSRTSLPHGIPSNKTIEDGDLVTLDFGCIVDGYCSDMTRTVGVGNISQEQVDVYNTVLNAQISTCNYIKAGVKASEADKKARDIITAAGWGECFGHGLGHGVGLEIHEEPSLNTHNDDVLKENMIVTIEPGIYIPDKFGVRIEDLAIVKSFGIINLCKSDKELIII